MGLADMIALALECNVFRSFESSIVTSAKDLRDTVHPLASSEYLQIDSADGFQLLLRSVKVIQSRLLSWPDEPPSE
jgi:hypothetical protein